MKIHILPENIANKIAAGEVVERPASVIKECVENSLDAQALNIEVRIDRGGKNLIEIRDDGEGMEREDAEKCILRHATSKITKIDDLFSINTFGFRGEALASIAAVSDFTLLTKTKSDNSGIKIKVHNGNLVTTEKAATNIGTIIKVANLFNPTPARKQFLKSDETEYRAIFKEMQNFALSNPQVNFRLFREEKCVFDMPVSKSKVRVEKVLKSDKPLLDIFYENPNTKISGFVCRPENCVTQKTRQFLFVNGRRIEDFRLNFAIRTAFVETVGLENKLHPLFVIFIDIDPILVDVNVHPQKLEVKFSEPSEIFRIIKNSIKAALEKGNHFTNTPNFSFRNETQKFSSPKFSSEKLAKIGQAQKSFFDTAQNFVNKNFVHEQENYSTMVGNKFSNQTGTNCTETLKLIGQVADKYILAESTTGILIFDQHALHERQRFEKFYDEIENKKVEIQKLLLSERILFNASEISILREQESFLTKIGFQILFLKDEIEILETPVLMENENFSELFGDFINFFENEKIGETAVEKFLRKILEYKSCRGAIMFSQKLTFPEMQKLLDDFHNTKWRLSCPHGRPNYFFLSFEEIDSTFHR
jgi:DNA mismatch repair protein MutL